MIHVIYNQDSSFWIYALLKESFGSIFTDFSGITTKFFKVQLTTFLAPKQSFIENI